MHSYRYLINVLLECLRACEHCTASAMEESDLNPLRQCVKINRDCADICILTSRLLERDSMMTNDILDTCIKITQLCADECEKFPEYSYCRECAEACRKAVKACSLQV